MRLHLLLLAALQVALGTRYPQAPEIVYVDSSPEETTTDPFSDSGDEAIANVPDTVASGPEPMEVDPEPGTGTGAQNLDAGAHGSTAKQKATDDSDYFDAFINSIRPDIPEARFGLARFVGHPTGDSHPGASIGIPANDRPAVSPSSSATTTDDMLEALDMPEGHPQRTAIVRRIGAQLAARQASLPIVPLPRRSGTAAHSRNAHAQTYISLPPRLSGRMERTITAALHDRHRLVLAPQWPAFTSTLNAEAQTPLAWTHGTIPAAQEYTWLPPIRGVHSTSRGGTYINLPAPAQPHIPDIPDESGISAGRAPYATQLFVPDHDGRRNDGRGLRAPALR